MSKDVGELLPLILIFILAAGLVYISLYPDLPKIEAVNEAPRRTGSQDYQEPPISNPQVIIVPPPIPPDSGAVSPTVQKTATGIANTLVMVALASLGGFGTYLLLRYSKKLAEYILAFSYASITVAAAAFFAGKTLVLVNSATGFWPDYWLRVLIQGVASIPLGIFVAHALTSRGATRRKRRAALAVFCSLASALMATVVPVFIILPLVLALALYDFYAVRRGPIKMAAEYLDGLDVMVMYEIGGWELGFGDLIFYSVLASSSLAYTMVNISRYAFYDISQLVGVLTPWAVFALVAIATLLGLKKAMSPLENKSLKPGLPAPILAGCGVFGLCVLALQLVNYIGWGWLVPPL